MKPSNSKRTTTQINLSFVTSTKERSKTKMISLRHGGSKRQGEVFAFINPSERGEVYSKKIFTIFRYNF